MVQEIVKQLNVRLMNHSDFHCLQCYVFELHSWLLFLFLFTLLLLCRVVKGNLTVIHYCSNDDNLKIYGVFITSN